MATLFDQIEGVEEIKSSNFIFARHETFHPRFGWIKKGFDVATSNSTIFLEDDTHIHLGVGKNMGYAIKYWCLAFKVLQQESIGRSTAILPTDFGKRLLGESGYDPFLEDVASLWLLHWKLLQPPCLATGWSFVFNQFKQIEFSPDDLFEDLRGYKEKHSNRTSDSSLNKDLSCILRMYCKSNSYTDFSEETLDCPFTDLGLIHRFGNTKHYRFNIGSKINLPAEIIVMACLEFVGQRDSKQRTISIANLLYEPNSPGMIFKLTESNICSAIEQVAMKENSVALSDSAGIVQFSFKEDPHLLSKKILDLYYKPKRG